MLIHPCCLPPPSLGEFPLFWVWYLLNAMPRDDPLSSDHTLRASLCLNLDHLLYPILATPLAYYWLITSHHTSQSGTYCSLTSDEPYACFLDYHWYLTCLYLPFEWEYKFPPEFTLRRFILPDHFAFFSPICIHLTLLFTFSMLHFASLCPTALLSLPITNSLLPHLETIPYPLIALSEPHWAYALITCSFWS